MNDTLLPPRLRYTSFQRYEAVIALIVAKHPADVPLSPPKGLSPITFAARLRDALLSLSRFDWKTDKVDRAKFTLIRDDIGVFHKSDGSVFGGSKRTNRAKADLIPAIFATTLPTVTVVNDEQSHFLCHLAAIGVLQLPIVVLGITPEQCSQLEDSFDVLLKPQPDGSTLIT